jgi:hypothetical protein
VSAHSRTSAALSLVAMTLMASRNGVAWNSEEHGRSGKKAYARACELVAAREEVRSSPIAEIRLRSVCNERYARLYGQACAIAGDYTSSPQELLSAAGALRVHDDISYFSLALDNATHFQPHSVREWRRHHSVALELAIQATDQKHHSTMVEGFEKAFYTNAFADHFLQDSFAAGHIGMNRAATSPGPAKKVHDVVNRLGLWVRSDDGEVWKTFGDGHLSSVPPGICADEPRHEPSELHVVRANAHSVAGVLYAFAIGTSNTEFDVEVARQIPTSSRWGYNMMPTLGKFLRNSLDDSLACTFSRPDPSGDGFVPTAMVRTPLRAAFMLASYVYSIADAEGNPSSHGYVIQAEYGPFWSSLPILRGFFVETRAAWWGRDQGFLGVGAATRVFRSGSGLFSVNLSVVPTLNDFAVILGPDVRIEFGTVALQFSMSRYQRYWRRSAAMPSSYLFSLGLGIPIYLSGGAPFIGD